MLTSSTLALLSDLQLKSHTAYPEGGLLYTYVEAANQAHARFTGHSLPLLSLEVRKELALFLQASQGDYLSESPGESFVEAAERLLKRLKSDLAFDEFSLSIENGGHEMEAKLAMARRSDNRFFALELWWSID